MDSDIEVLTEAGRPDNLAYRRQGLVASDPRRADGESWVVIRGKAVTACDFVISRGNLGPNFRKVLRALEG